MDLAGFPPELVRQMTHVSTRDLFMNSEYRNDLRDLAVTSLARALELGKIRLGTWDKYQVFLTAGIYSGFEDQDWVLETELKLTGWAQTLLSDDQREQEKGRILALLEAQSFAQASSTVLEMDGKIVHGSGALEPNPLLTFNINQLSHHRRPDPYTLQIQRNVQHQWNRIRSRNTLGAQVHRLEVGTAGSFLEWLTRVMRRMGPGLEVSELAFDETGLLLAQGAPLDIIEAGLERTRQL